MRKTDSIPATAGMFRNMLAPAAALFLGLGALLGFGSVLYLLDPGYLSAIHEKILISGIRSASAQHTWTVVHILISLICWICPAIVVWGMVRSFRGHPARGMNLLSNAAHGLLILLRFAGWILLALFCLRFTRYLISILRRQDWPYLLMATVLMEAMVLSLAIFSFRLLCRFLDESEGCAASIGYTLSSGFLDPGSIPAFVSTGLTALAVTGLVLAADRIVTMTIGSDGLRQFYTFVLSAHPGLWLNAGSLFFGAVGNLLLSGYLRFYKRTSERAVFFASYPESMK